MNTHEQHMQAHREALRYFKITEADLDATKLRLVETIQLWYLSLKNGTSFTHEKRYFLHQRMVKMRQHIYDHMEALGKEMNNLSGITSFVSEAKP